MGLEDTLLVISIYVMYQVSCVMCHVSCVTQAPPHTLER
jgi:hypothetical protein